MAIRILPEDVVAQIAAGEVVERPASAVKELLENALDSGAGSIHVAVSGGGRERIRVSDDGCGIPSGEVDYAALRHATSKLQTTDDLMRIKTLGFRGEALSSIAAVSHLTLTTRARDEATGTFLRLEGGHVAQRRAIGTPPGTVVSVEHLFYNTPARLKFLKKESTEKRQIVALVSRYAMAYPAVRFILDQDGREVFRSNGNGQLSDVLVAALGLEQFTQMIAVEGQQAARDGCPEIRVHGYTSEPGLNRADRKHITLFVNGRWIQDSGLSYAVTQAYHTFLMSGRYPITVLMIEMPPEEIDVNVHPTKAEVRFRDANAVFAAVQRAVRRCVVDFSPATSLATHAAREWHTGVDNGHAGQLDMELTLETPGQYPGRHDMPANDAHDPTAIPTGPEAPIKPRTLPMLRVVGQVGATYIVAEGPAGMYLVDQHAAHERILYEQFMERQARQEGHAQRTLPAQTIDLSEEEAQLLAAHLDVLRDIGFELETFGPRTFVVRSVPALLAKSDPVEAVLGIIDDLDLGREPGQASVEEKIIVEVCKRAAVKAGQVLTMREMEALIRQLERCESPHTCPHGRPTIVHMSSEHLAREFGRR